MRLPLLLALFLILAPKQSATASALAPTVQAAISANGRVLCYLELRQHSDNNGNSYQIDSVTYHILTYSEAPGPHSYIGTLVPSTGGHFWTGFAEDWSITLTGWDALNWPVVSDDGDTLALASYGWPTEKRKLLSVYHRNRGSNPLLVGSYTLADLWTRDEIASTVGEMVTGAIAPWYASGNFTFSPEGDFVYANPRHYITHIDVVTGKLTHNNW